MRLKMILLALLISVPATAANLHVLESPNGVYTVVCHFPVPVGNNNAQIPWRTAYLRYLGGAGRANVTKLQDGDGQGGSISAVEKDEVVNGITAEKVHIFTPPGNWPDLTNAQKAAILTEWYLQKKTEFNAWRVDVLDDFGRTP